MRLEDVSFCSVQGEKGDVGVPGAPVSYCQLIDSMYSQGCSRVSSLLGLLGPIARHYCAPLSVATLFL